MAEYYVRVCPVCEKKFLTIPEIGWAYKSTDKYQTKYFCSWTCVRAYEKDRERKMKESKERTYKKKRTRFLKNEETGEIISAPELARRYGVLYQTIARYYTREQTYRGFKKYTGSTENEK